VAKKNANGDGMRPRKRKDGRWEARYWSEGRRRSVYGRSRKEVVGKLAEVIDESRDEGDVATEMTVAEFLGLYGDVARGSMKRRSSETYESIAKVHLLPELGDYKVGDLGRDDVQGMYSRKLGGGLSAARVRRIHGVLSSALNHAVSWRLVERNVCREVSPPRVPAPEIRPFSLEEAKTSSGPPRGTGTTPSTSSA
jgi:integrase